MIKNSTFGQPTFIYILRLLSMAGLFLSTAAMAITITVFVRPPSGGAPEELELDTDSTMAQLIKQVGDLGYDPTTLKYSKRPHAHINAEASLGDYGISKFDLFTAEKKKVVDPAVLRRREFLKAAWEGDKKGLKKILKAIEAEKRSEFVTSCRSEDDHDKTAPYYAARMGHLDVLKAIKKLVTKGELAEVLSSTDDEGRTVLMAAARAVEKQKKTIDFIVKHAPESVLRHVDNNGLTAYDWAVRTGVDDKDVLATLLRVSGTNVKAREENLLGEI